MVLDGSKGPGGMGHVGETHLGILREPYGESPTVQGLRGGTVRSQPRSSRRMVHIQGAHGCARMWTPEFVGERVHENMCEYSHEHIYESICKKACEPTYKQVSIHVNFV